jgi:hypothetical protein
VRKPRGALAVAGADDIGSVAAIEHRFQNSSGFRWKIAESNLFFFALHRDAGAQAIGLNVNRIMPEAANQAMKSSIRAARSIFSNSAGTGRGQVLQSHIRRFDEAHGPSFRYSLISR